jgi:hypothetical protein
VHVDTADDGWLFQGKIAARTEMENLAQALDEEFATSMS